MFARAFYALRYFAARFFPQSQGGDPPSTNPAHVYRVPGAVRSARSVPGAVRSVRTLPTADLSGGT